MWSDDVLNVSWEKNDGLANSHCNAVCSSGEPVGVPLVVASLEGKLFRVRFGLRQLPIESSQVSTRPAW